MASSNIPLDSMIRPGSTEQLCRLPARHLHGSGQRPRLDEIAHQRRRHLVPFVPHTGTQSVPSPRQPLLRFRHSDDKVRPPSRPTTAELARISPSVRSVCKASARHTSSRLTPDSPAHRQLTPSAPCLRRFPRDIPTPLACRCESIVLPPGISGWSLRLIERRFSDTARRLQLHLAE
jgi:hypothetical protein